MRNRVVNLILAGFALCLVGAWVGDDKPDFSLANSGKPCYIPTVWAQSVSLNNENTL